MSRKISLIAIVFIASIVADQVTKMMVRSHLAIGETYSWLHDTVRLTHAENAGAFLSLGAKLPENVRLILFSAFALVISAAALVVAFRARNINHYQIAGLALVAAGGFGNWIDRMTNSGHVTDFMNIGIGALRTGIFNVADMALMVGAGLFAFAAQKPAVDGR